MALDYVDAYQDTEQQTTSSSYVDASCETSALASGVEHLVIYRASGGTNNVNTDILTDIQLLHGSTQIAQTSDGGSSYGHPNDRPQCDGFTKITGNGSDTLKFQFRDAAGEGTAAIGAMAIIAIELDDLTEDTDWFFDGTDSSALEVEEASTSPQTLRSVVFNLPDDGDYVVLMSCEAVQSLYSESAKGTYVEFHAGGSQIADTYIQGIPYQQDQGVYSFTCVERVNLSSGNNTFEIKCYSYQQPYTDFLRSRIWVLRADSFDQTAQTQDTTGENTTSTSYVEFDGLETTYTPNQAEPVLVLGHMVAQETGIYPCQVELYNDDDAAEYNAEAGVLGQSPPQIPTLLAYVDDMPASAETWKVRYRLAASSGTARIGETVDGVSSLTSNLVFISLTAASGGGGQSITASPASVAVDAPAPTVAPGASARDATPASNTVDAPAPGTAPIIALAATPAAVAVDAPAPTAVPQPTALSATPASATVDAPAASAAPQTTARSATPASVAHDAPAVSLVAVAEIEASPASVAVDAPAPTAAAGTSAQSATPAGHTVDAPVPGISLDATELSLTPASSAVDAPAPTLSPEAASVTASPAANTVDAPAVTAAPGAAPLSLTPASNTVDAPAVGLDATSVEQLALTPASSVVDAPVPGTATGAASATTTPATVSVDAPAPTLVSLGALQSLAAAPATVAWDAPAVTVQALNRLAAAAATVSVDATPVGIATGLAALGLTPASVTWDAVALLITGAIDYDQFEAIVLAVDESEIVLTSDTQPITIVG